MPLEVLPTPPPSPSPLTADQFQQLESARAAAARIRRTAGVARVSAWTTGIIASLTLLGVLFGDVTSLFLGGALLAIAIREGRLATRVRHFDIPAPRLLALNQATLGAVLVLYAAWQVWTASTSSGLSEATQPIGDPKVDAMLADIGSLTRRVTIAFYALVALGGALSTSLMALYYARCTSRMRPFLAETPEWVIQTMRATA